MKKRLAWLFIPGVVGILALGHKEASQVNICTFEQGQILREFTEQLISHEISNQKAEVKTRQFASALKKALDDYAKSRQIIILDKNKVLAGDLCDVTEPVKSLVSKYMQGER